MAQIGGLRWRHGGAAHCDTEQDGENEVTAF
jgi:hypothetical protein